ncbi:MAG: hypothetical protein JXA46_15870 [Dehalococcoidales bacterium]|nr:hypothetical protein [Dehalococcoidales bacterium]
MLMIKITIGSHGNYIDNPSLYDGLGLSNHPDSFVPLPRKNTLTLQIAHQVVGPFVQDLGLWMMGTYLDYITQPDQQTGVMKKGNSGYYDAAEPPFQYILSSPVLLLSRENEPGC